MRITIDIPENLILEAMELTGAKSKSQLVAEALKAQIDAAKRKRIISFKGKIAMDLDLDKLRDRK